MNKDAETSKPFVAVNCIDYADKSVVSKTIVRKPTGNITLFAFDQGEGLAAHSSPHEVLVQILDGQAEITIGGTPPVLCALFYFSLN